MISILCVAENSNYRLIEGLDLWDAARDAYNFKGTNPVIVHPPCQQWSKMKSFAKDNPQEKELAFFCLDMVHRNGGILEHPAGSSFFKVAGIKPTLSIDQKDFGFPARKRTYLYFCGIKPNAVPLSFAPASTTVDKMHSAARSIMPLNFCTWLVRHF